ncbi:hypothetical protein [Amycolatopsis keratiniphila]|uniref:hypothetical protein n=1 Tax=Amycolatopsis keratiniphila TaxID=129921 RepID=UPI0007ACE369|nr:hypothetical protein [Amycolatopsis keratiniphila]SDU32789.1 hypothetical protein SAMN04489733_3084 [Amycolatopsis keratiniphila]
MKLFGRRAPRPEPERRTLILDHCYDDLALDAALDGLREGDLRAARTVLAESREDAETRGLRLDQLSKGLVGHADEIAELARQQDEPELWLMAGAAYLDEAMAIRGTGWAEGVGQERFKMVHQVGAKAIGPLHRAAELIPDDSTPWVNLMSAALVLSAPRDQRDEVWRETVRRSPAHFSAHMIRLQTLAPKWGGTEQEMLTFALETARAAPPGDPLTAIQPAACFEVYLMASRQLDDDRLDEFEKLYFSSERMQATLVAASDRWLAEEKPHPRGLQAHHYFAAAFACGGNAERAFLHLLGTRDRFYQRPWAYLDGSDPEGVYHRMVGRYWPSNLHLESPMDLSPVFPD